MRALPKTWTIIGEGIPVTGHAVPGRLSARRKYMNRKLAQSIPLALSFAALCSGAVMERPKAGKVEIMKSSEIKPGMQATAWTVFVGKDAEAVPVEIIGLWKNAWGPRQDIIVAKMG